MVIKEMAGVVLLILGFVGCAFAADAIAAPQIHSPIDETQRITLFGSTPPEARHAKDLGRAPDSMRLLGLQLALRRSAAQEQAVEALIHDQLDRKSVRYHRWITSGEYGSRFGVSIPDLNGIVWWLRSHGFKVNGVSRSRVRIDFSGTVGDIRESFNTEIHWVRANGMDHYTNMSDPQIPAALGPVVAVVAWLNNFRPKAQYTGPMPGICQPFDANGNKVSTCYWVVPADIWNIYNFPVSTYNGAGQTIVVMEDGEPLNGNADWCAFRTSFVETSCTVSLFQIVNPHCTAPTGDAPGEEVAIDPEWASAAAPGADIVMASCKSNGGAPGYLVALENYIDDASQQIISLSFGTCEEDLGIGGNSVLNATFQQAASEGFSVFVAAGDGGAAGCDFGGETANAGITVSGFASSPHVVAVGGSTFADRALGNPVPSPWWKSQNGQYYGSALSYIPEIAWNSSCGNELLSYFYTDEYQTYGPTGFCNNSQYINSPYSFLTVQSGSGGPSSCAVALPGGTTCEGYPKSGWQSGIFGNPGDAVRDVPDVSIAAGGPEWGHALVYCDAFFHNGGCTDGPATFRASSGTSFSAPIFAGIQALINQHVGGKIGNPDVTYYALAKEEYGPYGNPNCLSVNVAAGNDCAFYDISGLVSSGDSTTVVPCSGKDDCFTDGAVNGVLSTSDSYYAPAYSSTPGWDFTTGIGTPNVTNLIDAWPVP